MRTLFLVSILALLTVLVSGCAHEHHCGPTCCAACCDLQQPPDPAPSRGGLSVDEWVARAGDPQHWNRQEVAANLAAFGPEVICHAEGWMSSDDAGARHLGAEIVRLVGPCAYPALPSLRRLCHDPEPQVRNAACRAIAALGPDHGRDAVDDLGRLLDDEVWECRYHAAETLGTLRRHSFRWLPKLRHARHNDRDVRVRRATAWAYDEIMVEVAQRHTRHR